MVGGKKNQMEIFNKGILNIVEINPNSFISTLELAKKSKTLIEENSSEWFNYLRKYKIDLEFISDVFYKIKPKGDERELKNHIYKSYTPELVFIKKGLMVGFYFFSKDIGKAYYYFENPKKIKLEPLKKYSLTSSFPEFDFVISYSNKDINLTREIFQILNFSFNLYFLDVEIVKEDPLWQIRYREAMYHSHYFIPVFSENYLTTDGALSEFFESVYLNIDFRTIIFYNYFIPFVLEDLSYEKIKSHIGSNEKEYYQYFNYDTKLFHEILNDINYGIKTENHSFKEIVIFLKSLLTNEKNNLAFLTNNKYEYEGNTLKDISFLKLLLKQTEYIIYSNLSEDKFNGKKIYALKIVTLFIKNSHKKWNILDILSDGRCINRQFTTEIQDDAIKVNEQTFSDVSKFLNYEEKRNKC